MRSPIAWTLCLAVSVAQAAPTVEEWPLPSGTPAAQPGLVAGADGLLLSWLEPHEGGHRLRYALDTGTGFDPPRDIASGTRWFVNWADVPGVARAADGRMAAFVLRRSADAPYAYDVLLSHSGDGASWSEPTLAHDDATPTEHGFASLWPWPAGGFALAWLDGRHTAGGHAHDGEGATSLRVAIHAAGAKRQEWELDMRTCDCCQTDVALSAGGPVLVYRDRDADEIRDIAILRWRDGAWSDPRPVHADRWHMPACPVNGPAVAALGADVYVAWYTVVDGTARVRLAHSRDDGATFAPPRDIDVGAEVLGRVDVAVDADGVSVVWLSEDAHRQTLWFARLARDLSGPGERVQVATLARGRGTGVPRLAARDGANFVVWTDVVAQQPRLRGARIGFALRNERRGR